MSDATPFQLDTPVPVRGFLHTPDNNATGNGLVLAHGAGSDSRAPLLITVAEAFATLGWHVLRIDLPYRQARPRGSPIPSQSGRDRDGIRHAVAALREPATGRIFAGGVSYGGRQTSMLAAEYPGIAAGLLLLSYPLHPPGKPQQLRTQHLPKLTAPCLFVHGTTDPFGSIEELEEAMKLIPGRTRLITAHGVGHDLGRGRKYPELFVSLPQALAGLTQPG